ncbi:LolA-related protein [Herminiimonas arsenitoxidans]|uniref:LolA-related protein n=1 Tax=Herminiimonas arsenitoxidans TaxID=1809410 RepID=UPI0009707EB7|nr:LolA-related protein [Herminiimonas arsenitoxidans]
MLNPARLLLTCLFFFSPLCASAQSWGLPQLMETMAKVELSQSRFTEKKTLALLKAPLESSGTLTYRRPGFVEKHALSPQDEVITVEGDQLTWQNNVTNKKRSIRLQSNPPIWAFVESIRATLAGDLKTLQRFYDVRLEGSAARWTLTLSPSDDAMRENVKILRIEGMGNRMTLVDILEAGGDRSIMTIQHD